MARTDKPSLEEIKQRAKYCSWHGAHGPRDVTTVIEMYEKSAKAAQIHLEKSKKHAADAGQARSEVKTLHKQIGDLRPNVKALARAEADRDALRAERNELRHVLNFIREAAEHRSTNEHHAGIKVS